MFVGSVDWLLSIATDLSGCRVRIFDCTREDIVWDSHDYPDEDVVFEINVQGFGEYEVCSYDLYHDNGILYFEINIEMEEEEDED